MFLNSAVTHGSAIVGFDLGFDLKILDSSIRCMLLIKGFFSVLLDKLLVLSSLLFNFLAILTSL